VSIRDSKAALRAVVQTALEALTPEQRRAASALACARLSRQPAWRKARAVLFYAPRSDEVDVEPLLNEALATGKLVALPRYVSQARVYEAAQIHDYRLDVVPGRFGIAEPKPGCAKIPLNQLDFVLVPGVCFDVNGHRLGRGRGYYDRLLGSVRGFRCGVAFDLQVRSAIPAEPHDVVLDCILTPTRWIC
jgi:5-formyltetrahydrofolate cyclo-ligase